MAKNKAKIRKIAINTGGGDAPGLNAVIRAVVVQAATPVSLLEIK